MAEIETNNKNTSSPIWGHLTGYLRRQVSSLEVLEKEPILCL